MSFLWMSNPQQRTWTTSISGPSPEWTGGQGCSADQSLICVLSASPTHHPTVPRSTQAQLLDGLSAPGSYGHFVPARPRPQPTPTAHHFHPHWWRVRHDELLGGDRGVHPLP